MKLRFILAITILCNASSVLADPSLYGKLSTMGLGMGLGYELGDRIIVRGGLNTFSYDDEISETDITYDANLDLHSAELLLDLHPVNGLFRLVGGVYYDQNEVSGTAEPTNGTYEINDRVYPANEIGSLSTNIDFDSVAPYLGIGFGRLVARGSRISWGFDIGALYQGSPNVRAAITCGTATTMQLCDQIQGDLDVEVADLENELESFEWWPVIGLTFSYRF